MPETTSIAEVRVGPQGRVVIPAALRQARQISTGEVLIARLEDDRLILEKPAQIAARVKQRFAALAGQPSLADELIAERATRLWSPGGGLSLAARACLALGLRYGVPIWTADRAWAQVALGVTVRVIRGQRLGCISVSGQTSRKGSGGSSCPQSRLTPSGKSAPSVNCTPKITDR